MGAVSLFRFLYSICGHVLKSFWSCFRLFGGRFAAVSGCFEANSDYLGLLLGHFKPFGTVMVCFWAVLESSFIF